MDPLSALPIACAAVQFADFGGSLIGRITKIYESTSCLPASDTSDVDEINRDLDTLHNEITSKSQCDTTVSEGIFIRHCKTCLAIGKELQECVKEASGVRHDNVVRGILSSEQLASGGRLDNVPMGVLSSARLASRQQRIKEKLEAIRIRLDRVRTEMVTALFVHMWAISKKPKQVTERSNLSPYMPALDTLVRLQQSGNSSISPGQGSPDLNIPQSVMAKAMWAMISLDPELFEGYQPQPALGIPWAEARTTEMCQLFLARRLCFENLGHRGGSIPAAHARTFEWVFEEPRSNASGELEWSSFSNWLRGTPDPGEVYWVTGKPGAGKSTLMKFIIQHSRTRELLGHWSGEQPLLVLDFYFWAAGSELQRSREGLLRTMLFQAVRNHPALVPLLFPKRWTLGLLFGQDALDGLELSFEELVNAFWIFLRRHTANGKVALFIDGLDEFHGDHQVLVELVKEMANTPNLQVCVSSRPWNTFRDVFSRGPSLRVELLTRDDIERYVKDHFSASEGFRELRVLNGSDATNLIKEVVEKAQGVFLWVRIVVNSLLACLAQGDSLRQLQDELNKVPEELSQVFDFIWQTLDSQHQIEAHRYFLMLRTAKKMELSLNAFSVWLSDDAYGINMGNTSLANVDANTALKALSRRLSSRTKGLIEIQEIQGPTYLEESIELSTVDYMHRSVMDWFNSRDSLPGSAPDLSPGSVVFDPALWLLKGHTLRLARCEIPGDLPGASLLLWFRRIITDLFKIALLILDNPVNSDMCISVMDRLDKELTRLSGIKPERSADETVFDFFGYFWITNKAPHWSNAWENHQPSYTLRDGDVPIVTDYLGFLTQVPVILYVRTKVQRDPSLLRTKFSKHYPKRDLVTALLGFKGNYLLDPELWQRILYKTDKTEELLGLRVELLRIFLESNQINIKRLERYVLSWTNFMPVDHYMVSEWRAAVLGVIWEFKQPTTSERILVALKLKRKDELATRKRRGG